MQYYSPPSPHERGSGLYKVSFLSSSTYQKYLKLSQSLEIDSRRSLSKFGDVKWSSSNSKDRSTSWVIDLKFLGSISNVNIGNWAKFVKLPYLEVTRSNIVSCVISPQNFWEKSWFFKWFCLGGSHFPKYMGERILGRNLSYKISAWRGVRFWTIYDVFRHCTQKTWKFSPIMVE